MSGEHGKPFFLERNRGLRIAAPEDDYLHKNAHAGIAGDSLTETQYFGICDPDSGVHGVLYLWHHPNLRTVMGGVWVWRGFKPVEQSCELFDFRQYVSDSVLSNDLHSFRLDSSYGVTVVEPLKKFHVTYSDPVRGNAIDLEYTAIGPAVLFGDGSHLEQPMKVLGEVRLRGQRYSINSYNVRDRSWGRLRSEALAEIPPVMWCTGVFSENFSFNCTAFDDPMLNPDWKDSFPQFSPENTFVAGWIYKDGELSEVVSCRKITRRDAKTLMHQSVQISLTDAKGRTYEINGVVKAASGYPLWLNQRSIVAMTRWECAGQVTYGDSQELQMSDYIYAMTSR